MPFAGNLGIDQVWSRLNRGLDVPTVAVVAAKEVTEVTLGASQLHGTGLPLQMVAPVSDRYVAEQDGLGEGTCIVEAITGLPA